MATPHQSQSQAQREREAEKRFYDQEQRSAVQRQAERKNLVQPSDDHDENIRSRYSDVEQPGLEKANLPSRRLTSGGDRDERKSNRDLEEITGNPGHYNINPNAPTSSFNQVTPAGEPGPHSINEPPEPVARLGPGEGPHSINEPPGSDVTPPDEGSGEDLIPELLSIDPYAAGMGDPDLTLTCIGEGFDETCVITFNGGDEETIFVSPNELTTIVMPSTASVAGEFPVTVKNAHGESEPFMFEFVEPARVATIKLRPKPAPKQSKKKKKR